MVGFRALWHTYRKPFQTSSWNYTSIFGLVFQLIKEFEPLVIIFVWCHNRNNVVEDCHQSKALVKIGNRDQVVTRIVEPQPKKGENCEHGWNDYDANKLSLLRRVRIIAKMENTEKQADQGCEDGEGTASDSDDFMECPGAGDGFCVIICVGKRIANSRSRRVMMKEAHDGDV